MMLHKGLKCNESGPCCRCFQECGDVSIACVHMKVLQGLMSSSPNTLRYPVCGSQLAPLSIMAGHVDLWLPQLQPGGFGMKAAPCLAVGGGCAVVCCLSS